MDTDSNRSHSTSRRTETVGAGDRGITGAAIGLTVALMLIVAASLYGPLKYLQAPPAQSQTPETAAAADRPLASLPQRPAAVRDESPAAPAQAVSADSAAMGSAAADSMAIDSAVSQMPTLMPAAPPSPQVAAQPSLPAREAGLIEAMRKGLLRPASGADLAAWKSRWSKVNGRDLPASFDERARMLSTYAIQRDLELPAGLHGAHAVIFVLDEGVPYPRGDAGHSSILDQTTGACMGPGCGMLLQ